MAASIPSVGSTAETATNVATPTTLSPGLPATRAVGDILLCLTVCRSGTPTVSCSTSGWVEIANVSATNGRLALYACKVDGSEAAAQPVWAGLTTGTSGTGASAQIACVRGLAFTRTLATLAHLVSAAQNQAASSTIQAMGAAITPTVPNTVILSLAVRQDNDVTDGNWPLIGTLNNVTWAKVAAVLDSASGLDHGQSWQWGQQGAATAIMAKTVTVAGGSSDASSAILVSLLPAQAITLAVAVETDAAQPLSHLKARSLTPAAETDAAQPLAHAKHVTITAAVETDTAQPLTFSQAAGDHQMTLTPAVETDSAVALAVSKQASLVPAATTDSAQPLAAAKHAGLAPATTTETAQPLSFSKYVTITAGAATDTAAGLAGSKHATLAPAASSDAAQPLSATKRVALVPALSTDASVALSITKQVSLAAAIETDAAVALAFSKPIVMSIAAAGDTDVAQPLTATKKISISPALETDTARALSITQPGGPISIIAAEEVDEAQALSVAKQISILSAVGTDGAQALDYWKTVTITAAVETDLAQALSIAGISVVFPAGTVGTISHPTFAGHIAHGTAGDIELADTGVLI